MQCGILGPLSGSKPAPPALEVQSFKHWVTGEVLCTVSLLKNIVISLFLTQFSLALLPALWTSGLKCGFWIWFGGPRKGLSSPEVQFPQRPSLPSSFQPFTVSPGNLLYPAPLPPSGVTGAVSLDRAPGILLFQTPWGPIDSRPAYLSTRPEAHFPQVCVLKGEEGHHMHVHVCPSRPPAVPVWPGFCPGRWWASTADGEVLHTLTCEDLPTPHT